MAGAFCLCEQLGWLGLPAERALLLQDLNGWPGSQF